MGLTTALARRLAMGASSLADHLADASLLKRCSKRLLVTLLGLMTAAGAAAAATRARAGGNVKLAAALPATDEALAAQRRATSTTFEWTLEAFSSQPSTAGERVASPWFEVGCKTWGVKLYPGGTLNSPGRIAGERGPPSCGAVQAALPW